LKGDAMATVVSGEFEVKLNPQKPDNPEAESSGLSRMSLHKRFHGALEATSKGEMLSIMTEVKGSGVYVAIERVTVRLGGRSGSFILHHRGIMTRGGPELSVTVVPDSGTGDLTGLAGEMQIKITSGKHFYKFSYTLPESLNTIPSTARFQPAWTAYPRLASSSTGLLMSGWFLRLPGEPFYDWGIAAATAA
jgi:hypothetical protein